MRDALLNFGTITGAGTSTAAYATDVIEAAAGTYGHKGRIKGLVACFKFASACTGATVEILECSTNSDTANDWTVCATQKVTAVAGGIYTLALPATHAKYLKACAKVTSAATVDAWLEIGAADARD